VKNKNIPRVLFAHQSEYLDFFRGLSALLVLFSHICQIFWSGYFKSEPLNSIVNAISGIAVMVFFVLSGFLISTTVYRNLARHNFNGFDSKKFLIDRLVRLYPPLLFSLLLMCIIYGICSLFGLEGVRMNIEWANILGSMFFLQNFYEFIKIPTMNGPLWSLSWEFWYYIFALLSVLAVKKPFRYGLCLFLLCLVGLYSTRALEFFSGLVVWCSGALVFFLFQLNWGRDKVQITLTYIALFVGLVVSYFFFSTEIQSNVFTGGKKYVAGLTFSIVLLLLLMRNNGSLRISENLIFRFFINSSTYSYTLYIIHFPILYFIFLAFDMSSMTNIALFLMSITSFMFCLLFSAFCSRYLEAKPILDSIKRFITRFHT
jgi:peptidoglycan/LPS O-acetylase OafA/YrhL